MPATTATIPDGDIAAACARPSVRAVLPKSRCRARTADRRQITYPYYTTRGPRDFLAKNPPSIGP